MAGRVEAAEKKARAAAPADMTALQKAAEDAKARADAAAAELASTRTALDEARANVPIAEAKVAESEAKVQFHSARIDRLRSMLDQQVSRGGAA